MKLNDSDQKMLTPIPDDIREVWLLHNPNGIVVRAIEEIGDPVLACYCEFNAKLCANYQNETYNIKCVPKRYKLVPMDS